MQLTDTHCHIQDASLELAGDNAMRSQWLRAKRPDPDAMIAYAEERGVSRLICVGTTLSDSIAATRFAQTRANCWASIGLHPHETQNAQLTVSKLRKLLELDKRDIEKTKIVAIGECGLDYFYQHADKTSQQAVLRQQIELALEYDLPIIFHVRDAFDDFWPIFDSYRGIKGVLHSFTDRPEHLERALANGLCIGVNGIITFTKHAWQLDMIRTMPIKNLLFETDAPFLTPNPLRGTVNEPAYIELIAKFVADLRQESLESIADATTKNALQLFSI